MSGYINFHQITEDTPQNGDNIIIIRSPDNDYIEIALKTDISYLKINYASPEEIAEIEKGVKNVYPLILEEIDKYATDELIGVKSMPLVDAEFKRSKIITHENLSALLNTYLTQNELSTIVFEIKREYQLQAYDLGNDFAQTAVQGRAAIATVVNADTMSEAIMSIDMSSGEEESSDE